MWSAALAGLGCKTSFQVTHLRLKQHGQATAVTLNLTLIISLLVAIIVVYQIFIATPLTAQTFNYSYGLLNTDFSDNTGNVPDDWDNVVTDNRLAYLDTTNNWIYENGDNGTVYWHQDLTVSNLYDGVTSATISARFKLGDNTGLTNLTARVYLENASNDNITIWETTSKDNSTGWISIDNNVTPYITATGTYTLFLWENVLTGGANNVYTFWDDTNLSVLVQDNYIDPDAQAARNNLVALSWAGIGLMAVAIVIIAAAMILAIVRGFGTVQV